MWSMLLLSAASVTPGDTNYAWALAYTSFVPHICPVGSSALMSFRPEFCSLRRYGRRFGGQRRSDETYRAGGRAAEAAHWADASFCDHPTLSQPERAPLLDRILVRTSPQR
jgi:hypothetical protein